MTHKILFSLLFAISMFATSCTKEEIVTVDSSLPSGAFTVSKTGNITAQSDTGSKGKVEVGKDASAVNFVKLGSDFTTVLATGTVSVYLSTSATFKADPGKGNPDLKLIGIISKNGEQYFKMSTVPEAKFTHLILWCGSANVPFGYAMLL